MSMTLQKSLIVYGLLALLLFLYSGYTLQQGFPDLYRANEIIRYQYRANHIYLLFSALLILLFSGHLNDTSRHDTRRLYIVVALLLILGHLLLTAAFYVEPPQARAEKPLTFYGIVTTLTAILLSLFTRWGEIRRA